MELRHDGILGGGAPPPDFLKNTAVVRCTVKNGKNTIMPTFYCRVFPVLWKIHMRSFA